MKNKDFPFQDKKFVIFENEKFILGQDWEVPIQGFFILSPKRKVKSFIDFSQEESYEFMDLLRKTRKLMLEKLNIKDVYFFQNEDSKHGFHFWIFPRFDWMKDFGTRIQSVRPIMNFAEENMFTEYNVQNIENYVKIMRDNFK